MLNIRKMCESAPMVPVLTIDEIASAVPLAQALVAGGIHVLEITLRTETALAAIEAVRAACPDAVVGAGTLRSAGDVSRCMNSGAQFGVSPGAPERLMDAVGSAGFAFLPGCASATEAMRLADRGYDVMKFFPAEAAGGIRMLASLADPLPGIGFCPTGGITPENAHAYLELPNVLTVGGSWVAPTSLIRSKDWKAIESRARAAADSLTR